MNMNKQVAYLVGLLGIVFIVAAFFYFTKSASNLPSFFPGHQIGLLKYHYKHGIGALLLGLGCFAFAWFGTGKKSK